MPLIEIALEIRPTAGSASSRSSGSSEARFAAGAPSTSALTRSGW